VASWGTTSVAQKLDFSIDGGVSFADSFNVGIGSSTTVEVYLAEITPDTTLSSEGLFAFGLVGDLEAGAAGAITSASINPQYDFPSVESASSIALEWEAAVFLNEVPTGPSILLGQFVFDSSGAGISNFTFGDNLTGAGSSNAGWFTENSTELDEFIFGVGATDTYSLSLNAVPEPGSFILFVMALVFFCVLRKRETMPLVSVR